MRTMRDADFMRTALEIGERCRDVIWYGVGCVVVAADGTVLGTGFTGELCDADGGMRHAEEIALQKLSSATGLTLYSTLEPCSRRASGKRACVDRIIEAGIGRVVYGAKEPYDPALGVVCEGTRTLNAAGIEVVFLSDFEELCLKAVISKRRIAP